MRSHFRFKQIYQLKHQKYINEVIAKYSRAQLHDNHRYDFSNQPVKELSGHAAKLQCHKLQNYFLKEEQLDESENSFQIGNLISQPLEQNSLPLSKIQFSAPKRASFPDKYLTASHKNSQMTLLRNQFTPSQSAYLTEGKISSNIHANSQCKQSQKQLKVSLCKQSPNHFPSVKLLSTALCNLTKNQNHSSRCKLQQNYSLKAESKLSRQQNISSQESTKQLQSLTSRQYQQFQPLQFSLKQVLPHKNIQQGIMSFIQLWIQIYSDFMLQTQRFQQRSLSEVNRTILIRYVLSHGFISRSVDIYEELSKFDPYIFISLQDNDIKQKLTRKLEEYLKRVWVITMKFTFEDVSQHHQQIVRYYLCNVDPKIIVKRVVNLQKTKGQVKNQFR